MRLIDFATSMGWLLIDFYIRVLVYANFWRVVTAMSRTILKKETALHRGVYGNGANSLAPFRSGRPPLFSASLRLRAERTKDAVSLSLSLPVLADRQMLVLGRVQITFASAAHGIEWTFWAIATSVLRSLPGFGLK